MPCTEAVRHIASPRTPYDPKGRQQAGKLAHQLASQPASQVEGNVLLHMLALHIHTQELVCSCIASWCVQAIVDNVMPFMDTRAPACGTRRQQRKRDTDHKNG